jgi:hypothetical protein
VQGAEESRSCRSEIAGFLGEGLEKEDGWMDGLPATLGWARRLAKLETLPKALVGYWFVLPSFLCLLRIFLYFLIIL